MAKISTSAGKKISKVVEDAQKSRKQIPTRPTMARSFTGAILVKLKYNLLAGVTTGSDANFIKAPGEPVSNPKTIRVYPFGNQKNFPKDYEVFCVPWGGKFYALIPEDCGLAIEDIDEADNQPDPEE